MNTTSEESQLFLKIADYLFIVKNELQSATEKFLQKIGGDELLILYTQIIYKYLGYLDKLRGELEALATQNNPEEKKWASKLFIRGFFHIRTHFINANETLHGVLRNLYLYRGKLDGGDVVKGYSEEVKRCVDCLGEMYQEFKKLDEFNQLMEAENASTQNV